MWINKSMPDSGPADKSAQIGRIPSSGSCSPDCSLILHLWITKKWKSQQDYKRKKRACPVGHKVKLALSSFGFGPWDSFLHSISEESLCVKHSVTLNLGIQSHKNSWLKVQPHCTNNSEKLMQCCTLWCHWEWLQPQNCSYTCAGILLITSAYTWT